MTPAEILAVHNRWRRGDDIPQQDPKEIGKAIDSVLESNAAMTALMIDCWTQFSLEATKNGETWRSDGGLSTLEAVADELVKSGILTKHPSRPLYRFASSISKGKT